jgi:hypothetical protein
LYGYEISYFYKAMSRGLKSDNFWIVFENFGWRFDGLTER